jgi:negative regulator of sigma-B (phosphoserine phosphatase)
VVLSLAHFDGDLGTMTWTGVGNIAGVLLRPIQAMNSGHVGLRPGRGVVGRLLPALRSDVVPVTPGDTLVLASDGINPQFVLDLEYPDSLQVAADRILADFGSATDDALVVIARYRGGPA